MFTLVFWCLCVVKNKKNCEAVLDLWFFVFGPATDIPLSVFCRIQAKYLFGSKRARFSRCASQDP